MRMDKFSRLRSRSLKTSNACVTVRAMLSSWLLCANERVMTTRSISGQRGQESRVWIQITRRFSRQSTCLSTLLDHLFFALAIRRLNSQEHSDRKKSTCIDSGAMPIGRCMQLARRRVWKLAVYAEMQVWRHLRMNDQVFYLDKTCSIDCFYQEKTLTIGSHPSGVSKAPSSAVLRCACMSSIGPTPSYDQHLPVHIMCFAMLQSIETDVLHFDRHSRMLVDRNGYIAFRSSFHGRDRSLPVYQLEPYKPNSSIFGADPNPLRTVFRADQTGLDIDEPALELTKQLLALIKTGRRLARDETAEI